MSEYIKREDAIKALSRGEGCGNICRHNIERLPSADVIEVVRCKDCKHWLPHTQCGFDYDNGKYYNYCDVHMPDDDFEAETWEADDYCSYGERKE